MLKFHKTPDNFLQKQWNPNMKFYDSVGTFEYVIISVYCGDSESGKEYSV
jgi:hypothetical protein